MWAHLSVHLCKLRVNFLTECIFLFSPKEKINFPTRCLKNFGEFESRNSIRSVFQLKKWVKVFKNGPRKIYRRQPLKNLKGYGLLGRPYYFKFLKECLPQILLGPFWNTLTQIRIVLN